MKERDRFVSDELVFDGMLAKAHRVRLEMPDGHIVQRDLIHYPGAVVILPVLADGSIVLIRNYRFAVDEHLWEAPAGMLGPGEPPETCAARELKEETGYTAGAIAKLGEFFTGPGTTDERMHAYLATDLVAGEQNLETYEQITVETFSDEQVRRMIGDGTLHDAKTIAALTLYWLARDL